MIQKYIEYVRDNPKGYWFKRKLYGWGWTPVRWQGWVTILVFIILIIGNSARFDTANRTEHDMLVNFLPQTVVLVAILLAICYAKGEKPKWQWGLPRDNEKKS